MKKVLSLLALLFSLVTLHAQLPDDFSDELVSLNWDFPVGIAWEKKWAIGVIMV